MTNTDHHLNREALDTLKDVMGDDFQLLISTFINDGSEHIQRLHTALNKQDSDAVRSAAHSFRGSCHNLGAAQLASLCEHVERRSLEGELDGLPGYVSKIEHEFSHVERILNELAS